MARLIFCAFCAFLWPAFDALGIWLLTFWELQECIVSLSTMDREAEYHFVTICFPAIFFGLIVAYLYLKDRANLR